MKFFDVVFPVNLGPLTYKCPESLGEMLKPGMIVSAPLKNKTAKGVVMGKPANIPAGHVKDIYAINSDIAVLNLPLIALIRWISEYYMAEQGLVLKNMLPKEAFIKVKKRTNRIEKKREIFLKTINIEKIEMKDVIESIKEREYKTFLLHVPSSEYDLSFLIGILAETRNAIIIVPEAPFVHILYPFLYEKFGERVCLFHSGLSRGQKSDAMERIISGHSDIICGTRSAVFAPLKKVSLIVVLQEHSGFYKQEASPCYNARDVAVMRGYLEKSTVLLSSICPSMESFFNCKSGKYTLLKPRIKKKKTKIKIVDMRYEKLLKPYLSKTVTDASARYLKKDQDILFVLNRRGHSTFLCMDCNYTEECPNCKIPLVFHKQEMSMKCHYCNYRLSEVPDRCGRCKSYNIKLSGAGTQRIQEDIEEILKIKTIRFDSDSMRRKADFEALSGDFLSDERKIIIGTKMLTRRLGSMKRFSIAAVLNPDISLNIPDFRSAERTYQELSSIIDKVEPDGEIFIQTRMPQNYIYKSLKNDDYSIFFREELHRRRELCYPPYSRLLLIKFTSKKDFSMELSKIIDRTKRTIKDNNPTFLFEILGPHILKNKKGENEYRVLLKSSDRSKLHSAANLLFGAFKGSKDIKIRVDVDPTGL